MSELKNQNTIVVDIGKTHVKIHLLDRDFISICSKQMKNIVVKGEYPSVNVEGIWEWLVVNLRELNKQYTVKALTFTTHGATAALIDRNSESIDGLVLPILDYEYDCAKDVNAEYAALRQDFTKTFSPNLPLGLNLGRQLLWLKKNYCEQFSKATDILLYPQYWAWRFTGKRQSEITSLGCHTDLWSIADNNYSSLVTNLQIKNLFPSIKPAYFDCGEVLPEVATKLGLNTQCRFFSGIHDSNASYLRYKLAIEQEEFTVISTGTWTVLMNSQAKLGKLDENKDMLANIDAMGSPIACARFMGGREFKEICEKAGSWLGEQFNESDVQSIIDLEVFALPNFSEGSGPFGKCEGHFIGPVVRISGIALATLYCALMIDYQLDMLAAKGKIFVEGAFLKNPILTSILSQLRQEQEVFLSQDSTGTVYGAAQLTDWKQKKCEVITEKASVTQLVNLQAYRSAWRNLINL